MVTTRSCDTCRYGDNGENPEDCSGSCFEPDLSDWEPGPQKPREQYLWPVAKPVNGKDGGE